jgi:hypothetical protein
VPVDRDHTRLIVRARSAAVPGAFFSRFADIMFGRPLHFVMERRMLLGIKERVEGTAYPPVVSWGATLGFLAASLLTSWYLMRKGEAHWLFLTLAVVVSLVKGSNDPRAALVGCVATTLTTLGVLRLRRWWAVDISVAAIVLLTLLFAHDAYVTIGVALLMSSVIAVVTAAIFGVPRVVESLPDRHGEHEADDGDEEQGQQPADQADRKRPRYVPVVQSLPDGDEHRR